MASLEEIRNERLKKLALLKEQGIDSYPVVSNREFCVDELQNDFTKLSKRKKFITAAGRVTALRGQGAMVFFNFTDGTGVFQGLLKKDEIKEKTHKLFVDTVDIGDIIELKGSLFTTKRKEKTLLVKDWNMLAKSLRPLPDKWHGLQDVEERFRRRYLDILMSEDVRARFATRATVYGELRAILEEAGYMEVDTPILQPISGGATAEPFITHHNALDIDLYLRIAPELYLKRLLVAGVPKVYEMGRMFRNEGIDATHNPEFTMLEFYESFSDAATQMIFVEKMLKRVVKRVHKKTKILYDEKTIDFSKKFAVVSYFDLLKRYALIADPENIGREELLLKAQQLGAEVKEGETVDKIMDAIYKKACRPKLVQPTFVVEYPTHYLPLAKKMPGSEDFVDAFQLVVGGIEMVKAFSELNDPIDQRTRFEQQEKMKEAGDKEAQVADEDFLEALEYGMPPAGGVGIGIDRLIMLLTDTKNIKEVIIFPTMRPKNNEGGGKEEESERGE